MSKRKIALIHSPEIYADQGQGVQFAPVWAYTLAAFIDESIWDIHIVDLTLQSREEIPECEIFAFSGINQDLPAIRKTHDYLKNKFSKASFILGGPITWSFDQSGKLSDLDAFNYLFILDGEETFPRFLKEWHEGLPPKDRIIRASRANLEHSRPMRFDLLQKNAHRYYGGVVEVSRGCPFLCEFCDIRVLPQNNQSNVKDPKLIVSEVEAFHKMGIHQIQFACDNFIGDLSWAREVVDALCEWTERTGAQVALYTWLTINISDHPDLMLKMRQAGFTSFFIGVESFNHSSILETSKLQNKNGGNQMVEALRRVHSYGFIVVPGLIFGFDSDGPDMFELMLDGIRNSGLLGGDPTFLIALPGTPLYRRMKRTGRLIDYSDPNSEVKLEKSRISKVESNIHYLQPREFLIRGFMHFAKIFTSGSFNYERFHNHVRIITESDHVTAPHSIGYGNLGKFLHFQFSSWNNFTRFMKRITLLMKPSNFWAILRGFTLVIRHSARYPGLRNHFFFWVFLWSNVLMKYHRLQPSEFNVHSIDSDYDLNRLWNYAREHRPEAEEPLQGGRNSNGVKVALQFKSTEKALDQLHSRFDSKEGISFSEKLTEYLP